MNIFVLSLDPVEAAQSLCDKHVLKMTVETTQLLSNAHPIDVAPYKHTHVNHPCTLWVKRSTSNYVWLAQHGVALAVEYTTRYGKVHASMDKLLWLIQNVPDAVPVGDLTPFAQAMPAAYKDDDAVVAYRRYYVAEKARFAHWRLGNTPDWWKQPPA